MLYVMAHVKGTSSYEFMTQREYYGQLQCGLLHDKALVKNVLSLQISQTVIHFL